MSQKTMKESAPPLAGDLLNGCEEIGAFLGWTERKTYHAISSGYLPGVFKIGNQFCARKSVLMAEIEKRERASCNDAA
jgi:hypothetical protein